MTYIRIVALAGGQNRKVGRVRGEDRSGLHSDVKPPSSCSPCTPLSTLTISIEPPRGNVTMRAPLLFGSLAAAVSLLPTVAFRAPFHVIAQEKTTAGPVRGSADDDHGKIKWESGA